MKDRFIGILTICVLLLLVVSTWWAARYGKRHLAIVDNPHVLSAPDTWAGSFLLLDSDKLGHVQDRLQGSAMRHFPASDTWEVDHPFFMSQVVGRAKYEIRADKATLYSALPSKDIIFTGHAVLKRFPYQQEEGIEIQSDKLHLLPDQEEVTSDGETIVHQGQSIIKGKGMVYNNRTRELQIKQQTNVNVSDADIPKK